jgi:hypothetical protein
MKMSIPLAAAPQNRHGSNSCALVSAGSTTSGRNFAQLGVNRVVCQTTDAAGRIVSDSGNAIQAFLAGRLVTMSCQQRQGHIKVAITSAVNQNVAAGVGKTNDPCSLAGPISAAPVVEFFRLMLHR